MKRAHSAA